VKQMGKAVLRGLFMLLLVWGGTAPGPVAAAGGSKLAVDAFAICARNFTTRNKLATALEGAGFRRQLETMGGPRDWFIDTRTRVIVGVEGTPRVKACSVSVRNLTMKDARKLAERMIRASFRGRFRVYKLKKKKPSDRAVMAWMGMKLTGRPAAVVLLEPMRLADFYRAPMVVLMRR